MRLNNLYYNEYLSNYDLIYKNTYASLYSSKVIKSINFEIPICNYNEIVTTSSTFKNTFIDVYAKIYFIFYILFCLDISITYKIVKNTGDSYFLKFSFRKKKDLKFFVQVFFNMYRSNLFFDKHLDFQFLNKFPSLRGPDKEKSYKIFNEKKNSTAFKSHKILNFKLKIFLRFFCFIDKYTNIYFKNFDLNENFLLLNFVIHQNIAYENNMNFIKNLSSFWLLKKKIFQK